MTSGWSEPDLRFMRTAILQAGDALSAGEVPVGAVIVIAGSVAGAAHNRSIRDCDPTAHAEVIALRAAAKSAGNYRISGATAYVTLEPCPMCIGAMLHARIGRLVFGAYDPNAGAAGSVVDLCNDRRLNHRIEVNGGLLAEECGERLKGFFASRRI